MPSTASCARACMCACTRWWQLPQVGKPSISNAHACILVHGNDAMHWAPFPPITLLRPVSTYMNCVPCQFVQAMVELDFPPPPLLSIHPTVHLQSNFPLSCFQMLSAPCHSYPSKLRFENGIFHCYKCYNLEAILLFIRFIASLSAPTGSVGRPNLFGTGQRSLLAWTTFLYSSD